MIIKACLPCNFYEIKQDEDGQMSYCQKETCWSQYSKRIAVKALEQFLNEECVASDATYETQMDSASGNSQTKKSPGIHVLPHK